MPPSRLLRTGGSFAAPRYALLYNGDNADELIDIGLATSTGGTSWTRHASNPVLTRGSAGSFDDEHVHGASLLHDGTQYIAYYGGFDGTRYRIGRATSPDAVTWTKYASNPVISQGSTGAFDDNGMNFPTVLYDRDAVVPWRMWYTAWKTGGKNTIGYATSMDGLAWTKWGQVIAEGSAGQFDDQGVATGPVIFHDGLWYIFVAGQGAVGVSSDYRTGYVTATIPHDASTYTKHGPLLAFENPITVGGVVYQSNQLRSIIRRGAGYIGWGVAFHPTTNDGTETSFYALASDLETWGDPTQILPFVPGAWDETNVENPSVIFAP